MRDEIWVCNAFFQHYHLEFPRNRVPRRLRQLLYREFARSDTHKFHINTFCINAGRPLRTQDMLQPVHSAPLGSPRVRWSITYMDDVGKLLVSLQH